VHRQRRRVDHAAQVHVQGCRGRGQQLARGICLEGEVVGARSDACIGEDKVNLAVGVDCRLEQLGERGPLRDVGLDEGEGARRGRRVDICADNLRAQGAEEFDGCEANARGAACEATVSSSRLIKSCEELENTCDDHDFALELGPGEVCICDLELCHIRYS
jgi:hypothetical protein